MWTPDDRAAQLIVAMIKRGWPDDAVGRVEARDIFEGLMQSGKLAVNAYLESCLMLYCAQPI